MKALKLLLVEDDELFRLGLSTRLQQESGIEVVAEAVDGETAVELTNQHHPNVVLLDVGLPGIGGVEACRQIRASHPNLPILVLTSHSQKPLIERLIAAGASGYCLKGVEAEVLVLALRSVAAGASWWDSVSTAQIRTTMGETAINGSPLPSETLENPLTKREQEILELMVAGKTNQEIAEILYIATGTVRVHVHAILQKLEVRDRTQAAVLALQRGLVAFL
ncbi:response regulator transcription factor [Oscillatoria salina]|uniref:response regulator transcription factor n=1 Tax=Oscillatoria salina TaxID=331517 RepID=UPI0013BA3973|nr:response regulator transcription factor [Oscillatoria salina]MBZ8182423.1 response regulator transcription factor [Oscillatoria salina IIICB1]NET90915.1 response regulator transcription factor [Kamptonema sp. SIO1D9]